MREDVCYYDSVFSIRTGEKKVVELTPADLWVRRVVAKRAITPGIDLTTAKDTVKADTAVAQVLAKAAVAPVTITAPDDTTQILINREPMAFGKWEGQLEQGFYIVNTVKDGLELKPVYLWVDDTLPVILDLSAPMASYGLLNIHSNVVGATVLVNGVEVGITPCVVEKLPASKPCQIRLKSKGYKDAEATVEPIGNDMVDVELNMKLE